MQTTIPKDWHKKPKQIQKYRIEQIEQELQKNYKYLQEKKEETEITINKKFLTKMIKQTYYALQVIKNEAENE